MKIQNLKAIVLLSLLLAFTGAIAQQQNNKWYFGNGAALDFNSGTPVYVAKSAMVAVEGCASVADSTTGQLLFYTDGKKVWDRSNQVMLNGSDLLGGPASSSTQQALIAYYPGKPGAYILFTTDETNSSGEHGFYFSVIDMTLNNGFGGVVAAQKNILLQTNATERLAIAAKANGQGFWVMIHLRDSDEFKAFSVTNAGVDPVPVSNKIGSVHFTAQQQFGDETMGTLKFNEGFTKLAVAVYAGNRVEFFDFDNCTGKLSNPLTVPTIDNPYGLEFSPDDSKLYYSLYYNAGFQGAVFQLDLLAPDIAASATLIGISSSINFACIGALQKAPDGKIYIAINNEPWLSAIEKPNEKGTACGFADKAVNFPEIDFVNITPILGLPQRVISLSGYGRQPVNSIVSLDSCAGKSSKFNLANINGVLSVSWNFDDPASGGLNNANTLSPGHIFQQQGQFQVKAIVNYFCSADTLITTVNIKSCEPPAECKIEVPSAFTPNGDNRNEYFSRIVNCPTEKYEFAVYNRWGNLMFRTTNTATRWDGSFNGQKNASGVYVYKVTYKFANKAPVVKYGTVTLIQ